MHCKNWKTILPFGLAFIIGTFFVTICETNNDFTRLLNRKVDFKLQSKAVNLKENSDVREGYKLNKD